MNFSTQWSVNEMKFLKINGQIFPVPDEVVCLEESCDYFVWQDTVFHKDDVIDEKDFEQN